jgi:hypothetical protein
MDWYWWTGIGVTSVILVLLTIRYRLYYRLQPECRRDDLPGTPFDPQCGEPRRGHYRRRADPRLAARPRRDPDPLADATATGANRHVPLSCAPRCRC